METGLVKYDAMVRAIAVCEAVDEAKAIRDKARALEVYAQQAMNLDAERKAAQVRIRAERRAGQLLKGQQIKAGRPPKNAAARAVLSDIGISHKQSSKWQKLADIPEDKFEKKLNGAGLPTTEGLIGKKQPINLDVEATQLKGAVVSLARDHDLTDPAGFWADCTDLQRAELREAVPPLLKFLKKLKEKAK